MAEYSILKEVCIIVKVQMSRNLSYTAEFFPVMMPLSITDRPYIMSIINKIVYALWYLRRPPWDSGQTPSELLEYLKTHPVGRAIDLGCGTGTNVISLAKQGWKVCGVDFVPAAVDQARRKAREAGVEADLRVGDVTRLEGIQGPFDFALDLGCFHSLPVPEKHAYLRQLERILAPGGTWFMYGFLRPIGVDAGSGLSVEDLARIKRQFRLTWRSDGLDRGKHRSAYFIYEKL